MKVIRRGRPMARNAVLGALLGILLTFVSVLAGTVGSASAAPADASSGLAALQGYYLQNQRNFDCLDAVPDLIPQDGGKVHLWNCEGYWWQSWYFAGDGTIRTPGAPVGPDNRCLDAWPVSGAPGGWRVSMWGCNGGNQQQWKVIVLGEYEFAIQNVRSGLCLDTPWDGPATGADVTLYACHFNVNQQWIAYSIN